MIFNQLLSATDIHVGGETFRFINEENLTSEQKQSGDKQALFLKHLLEEPRGHSGMRACIVSRGMSPEVDATLTFIDTEGANSFIEHGLFAATTYLTELSDVKKSQFCFEVEGEKYHLAVTYDEYNEEVKELAFEQSVSPEFKHVLLEEHFAHVVQAHVAIAITDVDTLHLTITNNDLNNLKRVTNRWFTESEKDGQEIARLVFYQKKNNGHYRYITLDKNGRIDRSPYLGAWAFSAFLYQKGFVENQSTSFELTNFLGHRVGVVVKDNKLTEGSLLDITVKGKGFVIGRHQFVTDPTDPLKDGFLLK